MAITPFKVTDFGTNREPVSDFLLEVCMGWAAGRPGWAQRLTGRVASKIIPEICI